MPMLFHYTSSKAAVEGILATGRIRLGRLPRTNDPRESMPLEFALGGFISEQDDDLVDDLFEFQKTADALVRQSVHLLCLTEDRPHPGPVVRGAYGTGPVRARMWAAYADNHAGVCLCFDAADLEAAAYRDLTITEGNGSRQLHHGSVQYEPEGEYPPPPRTLTDPPKSADDLPPYIARWVSANVREVYFR